MKKYHIKKSLFLLLSGALLGMTSCVGDLDTEPLDKDELVSNVVFKNDINAYTQSLPKSWFQHPRSEVEKSFPSNDHCPP